VEEILRKDVQQKDQNPRLNNIGRLTSPTLNDKLQHLLGCTTLLEDYEHFRKRERKNPSATGPKEVMLSP
jgi:hypothetical protein